VSLREFPQRNTIALAALSASLVIGLLGGCGGGSDNSTEPETAVGTSETTATAAAPARGGSPQKPGHTPPAGGGGEGKGRPNAGSPSEGSEGEAESESGSANPSRSLQTFGSSAEGKQEAEVLAAFRGYLKDVVNKNFAGVCHVLTDPNLEQLKAYVAKTGKAASCPALLAKLLAPLAQPARDAAAGKIGQVRLKGTDAIVLFTPRGGKPSWFTMTEEAGRWRVISLTAGTPLNPLG
jgi:hypothetical protein